MCVIMVAWQVHSEFPLVFICNRDEYFARDTLAAAPWGDDAPHVFGGRDGVRGGTWLSINDENGRIAAVTNYRDGPLRNSIVSPKSRGLLTVDWLKSTDSRTPKQYLESIEGKHFDGYNLIVGDVVNGLWFSSNWVENGAVKRVDPGIVHGVANHYMDAPGWPKVETARKQLESLLVNNSTLDEDTLIEELFRILENDKTYEKELLVDTGLGVNVEKLLSSMFVKADEFDYGTRQSSVIVVTKSGRVHFVEKTFGRTHTLEKQSEHCFKPETTETSA